ncbi:MAG: ferrous iron transport protein A [Acidobacteria bacterium]|nr:ferrous iron transport protein A [Acidobacteriota bacterium]
MSLQLKNAPATPAAAVSLEPGTLADVADSVAAPRDETCLDCLPHGVGARVVGVRGAGAISRRLMEMGVVPGARVSVVKAAPLGDPLEVRVRSYHLALRRSEAAAITVVAGDE